MKSAWGNDLRNISAASHCGLAGGMSLAALIVNNWVLTWTQYRSIYTFTRALLLLPPVFGARTFKTI
jgi:hypothetical protein